jgi:hypothetical protein
MSSVNYPHNLPSQTFFEELIYHPFSSAPYNPDKYAPLIIIYFTAHWCGACQRVDLSRLMSLRPDAVWYKCDVDENTYTPGYCSVKSLPSFQAIVKGHPIEIKATSNMTHLIDWVTNLPTGTK